jgi:hypothetical protein
MPVIDPQQPTPTYRRVDLHVSPAEAPGVYEAEIRVAQGPTRPAPLHLDREALRETEADAEAYGRALGAQVFAEDALGPAYHEARGVLQSQGQRMRLYLQLDPPELQAVRWERLYRPQGESWVPITTTADVLLSRYVSVGDWRQFTPQTERPVRVLVVLAAPRDLKAHGLVPLSAEAMARWHARFDGLAAVEATYLQSGTRTPPTLENLQEALVQAPHIVHIVCHGRKDAGDTELYLEDDLGMTRPVTGQRVLELLQETTARPALCFLAACESARWDEGPGLVALAPRLVRDGGVPAVVAMADRVDTTTVEAFAKTFYEQLLTHGTLDRAVHAARARAREGSTWDVPVLFTRLPANQLLTPSPQEDDVTPPNPVRGIPAGLSKPLHEALLDCDEVYDAGALRAVFRDQSLRPWRARLPTSNNAATQVSLLLDFLADKYRVDGRNALVMFLQVMAEQPGQDPATAKTLRDLAKHLAPLK